MVKTVGLRVVYLERVAVGDVLLDASLPRGAYRPLTGKEVARLFSFAEDLGGS